VAVIDPLLEQGDGHTPLDPDDYDGLIPTYITTRGELNEAEQRNIVNATRRKSPGTPKEVLDDIFLRRLHRDMFGDVWAWAGEYRIREMNVGHDPQRVAVAVRDLCDDARWWITAGEDTDLVAARFHHRLVSIHPFRNGNGRHARRATDLLRDAARIAPFTWGAGLNVDVAELRGRYLTALRAADRDRDDLAALVTFATS
jgi:Fic-DOC domain mobile mystery protein B